MAHWYNENAELVNNANLRMARKENLYPSVTTVLSEIRNTVLEEWKMREAVKYATIKDPFVINEWENLDEGLERYATFVVKNCLDNKAADFGTTVHNLIERYCVGSNVNILEYDIRVIEAYQNIKMFIDSNVDKIIYTEKTIVSKQLGYAGTIDLVARLNNGKLAIIDFKTTGGALRSYPSYCHQLAAYKIMYEENNGVDVDSCINVIVSSKDDAIKIIEHKNDKIYLSKIVFLSALNIFRYSRNFILEEQNGYAKS